VMELPNSPRVKPIAVELPIFPPMKHVMFELPITPVESESLQRFEVGDSFQTVPFNL
jgi:hypothetical protein